MAPAARRRWLFRPIRGHSVSHGTTGYRRGCRCAECREAHRVTAMRRRRERGIRPIAVTPVAERLWAKVHKTEDCWLWTGTLDGCGYGMIRIDRQKQSRVHRVVYEFEVGPIPRGFQIDHLCRVRNCVNPAHLEPVTHRENMFRSRRSHCFRGHEFTEENTLWMRACRRCAREGAARRRAVA